MSLRWLGDFHRDERGFLAALPAILKGVATVAPLLTSIFPQAAPITQALGFAGTGPGMRAMPARGPAALRERVGGRRMNVLNSRALSRSIRRVKGFSKFAKRVGSYTDPGRAYRLKGFRKRRRA